MRKHILLVLLIFVFSLSSAFAQIATYSGYVILNNNDTLKGRIEAGYFKGCNFIKEGSKRISFYTTDDIKEFYTYPNSKIINYKISNKNEKVFLKEEINGKVNLYKYQVPLRLFINKDTDQLFELIGGKREVLIDGKRYNETIEQYKGILKAVFNDTSYNEEINKLVYNHKAIKELIIEYNNKYHIVQNNAVNKNELKRPLNIGLTIGHNINSITISNSVEDAHSHIAPSFYFPFLYFKTSNIQYGMFLRYKFLRINSSFLTTGIYFNINSNERNECQWQDMYIVLNRYSLNYKYSILSLPLNYEFEFSSKIIRPYWSIGINNKFYFDRDISLSQEVYNNNNLLNGNYQTQINIPFHQVGIKSEFGFKVIINKNRTFLIGISGEVQFLRNHYNYYFFDANNYTFFISMNI